MRKIVPILALVGCISCAPSRIHRNVNIEENEIEPVKTFKPSLLDFLSKQRSLVDYREIHGFSKGDIPPEAPQVHEYHQEKLWRRQKPIELNDNSFSTQTITDPANSLINNTAAEPKKHSRRLSSRGRRPTVTSKITYGMTEVYQADHSYSTPAAIDKPATSFPSRRRRPTASSASASESRGINTPVAFSNTRLSTVTANDRLNQLDLQEMSGKSASKEAYANINEITELSSTTASTTSTYRSTGVFETNPKSTSPAAIGKPATSFSSRRRRPTASSASASESRDTNTPVAVPNPRLSTDITNKPLNQMDLQEMRAKSASQETSANIIKTTELSTTTASTTSTFRSKGVSQTDPINTSPTTAINKPATSRRPTATSASATESRPTNTPVAVSNARLSIDTTNKPLNQMNSQEMSGKSATQETNANFSKTTQLSTTTASTTSTYRSTAVFQTDSINTSSRTAITKPATSILSQSRRPIASSVSATERRAINTPVAVPKARLPTDRTNKALNQMDPQEMSGKGATQETNANSNETIELLGTTSMSDEFTTENELKETTVFSKLEPTTTEVNTNTNKTESSTSTNLALVDEATDLSTHLTLIDLETTDFFEITTQLSSTIQDLSVDTNTPIFSTNQEDLVEISTKSESKPCIKLSKAVNLDSSKNEIARENINPRTIDYTATYLNNVTTENLHKESSTYSHSTVQTTSTDENLLTTRIGFTELKTYSQSHNITDIELDTSTSLWKFDTETTENNTPSTQNNSEKPTTQKGNVTKEPTSLTKVTNDFNSLVTQTEVERTTELLGFTTSKDSFTTDVMEAKLTTIFQIIVKDDLESKDDGNSLSQNLLEDSVSLSDETNSLENNDLFRNNATKPLTFNNNLDTSTSTTENNKRTTQNNSESPTTQTDSVTEGPNKLTDAIIDFNSLVTHTEVETTTELLGSSTSEDSFTTSAMEMKLTTIFQSKDDVNSLSRNFPKDSVSASDEINSLENNDFVWNNATKQLRLNINKSDGKIDVLVMSNPNLNAPKSKPDKNQVIREDKSLSTNLSISDSNNSSFNEPIVVAETIEFSDDLD